MEEKVNEIKNEKSVDNNLIKKELSIQNTERRQTVGISNFKSSPSIINLLKGILEFQKLMADEKIITDATNPFYNSGYLTLAGLIDIIKPNLNKAGLVIVQMPMEKNNEIYVNTKIFHVESGEYFDYNSVALKKGKNAQDIIGDSTYLKRASLMSLCLVSPMTDDDDGNQNKTRNEEKTKTSSKNSGKANRL